MKDFESYDALHKELKELETYGSHIVEAISSSLRYQLNDLIKIYEEGIHDGYEDCLEDPKEKKK